MLFESKSTDGVSNGAFTTHELFNGTRFSHQSMVIDKLLKQSLDLFSVCALLHTSDFFSVFDDARLRANVD